MSATSELVQRWWCATEERQDGYALIAQRYQEGATYRQISIAFGCGSSTIARALAAHGVEPRPDGRPKGLHTKLRKSSAKAGTAKANRNEGTPQGFWPKEGVCGRCGLLLSEKPGRVAGLCAVCCEEIARGVLYADGELPAERLAAVQAELVGVAA
jgi:hypothetical protein